MTSCKIAILDRIDSNINPGGDTYQIVQIANFLKKNGAEVVLYNELFPNLKGFDYALVFNLTRYGEAFFHVISCLTYNVKYILFPVYWNFSQINIPYYNISSFIKQKIIGPNKGKIKAYYQYYFDRSIKAYKNYIKEHQSFFLNEKKGIEFIINHSYCICPNSKAEWDHINSNFKIKSTVNHTIILNGIPKDIYKKAELNYINRQGIYCVGGIGPRKNQLNLAKSIENTDIKVNLIGKANKSDLAYYNKLLKYKNVHLLGWLKNNEILDILSSASIHIQPSFIETPGIASMEAYALGCKVIVSDVPPVREYFGDDAIYIDPYSPREIKRGIEQALQSDTKINIEKLKSFNERYNWETVLKPINNIF